MAAFKNDPNSQKNSNAVMFISNSTQKSNSGSWYFFSGQNDDTSSISEENYDNGAELFDELMVASGSGRGDVVRRIIKSDRDMMSVGDPVGDTAFHMAAGAGNCDVVLEMIRNAKMILGQLNRAMVDQNVDGDTTLHLAIKNCHLEAARSLANACDPNTNPAICVPNKDGECPRELAEQHGYIDLVKSAWSDDEESNCVQYNYVVMVVTEMELNSRALEEDSEEEYMTNWHKLCKAIRLSNEEVPMRILEEEPSLMQHVDSLEGTALHVAARAEGVA